MMAKTPWQSRWFAAVLHLLLPGLGHCLWKDYLFGIFVFLITLIAALLFLVSLFVHLGPAAKTVLIGLPLLFYVFSFVDLSRSIGKRRGKVFRSGRVALFTLLVGVGYQVLCPLAPANFCIVNAPEPFRMPDNSLSPLHSRGDLLKADRLAYTVRAYLVDRPIWHSMPERYDVVRFSAGDGRSLVGVVVGLPLEQVEIIQGLLVVNDQPDFDEPPAGLLFGGDWPLTAADEFSILVATLNLGSIAYVYQVPLTEVRGKVSKLY